MKKIVEFFIPEHVKDQPELFRKYRLTVSIMLITSLFDLNYAAISSMVGLTEGINIMLITFAVHLLNPFMIRQGQSILWGTNIYVLFGVFGIVGCTYYSGGFDSSVIIWLASTPIVALLMAGRKTGFTWAIINTLIVVVFSTLSKEGYVFPNSINPEWDNMFLTNTLTGMIIIIFIVSLVFENGKNAAQKQLAAKTALLAEEKKKNALYAVSQDIHDNVGQRLFLTKLSLSNLDWEGDDQEKLNLAIGMLNNAIDELRDISHDINDENSADFDLQSSLKNDLDTIKNIGSHDTVLEVTGDPIVLNKTTGITLYRMCQEVISNSLKHAQAKHIAVKMAYEMNSLQINISDDGIGLSKQGESQGQGLRTLEERAEKIGAKLEIISPEKGGTEVQIAARTFS
ncbi:MAG: sensor histidine kinase [Cyclobacteriaceae bacterium]